jgi:hypothetical protein
MTAPLTHLWDGRQLEPRNAWPVVLLSNLEFDQDSRQTKFQGKTKTQMKGI